MKTKLALFSLSLWMVASTQADLGKANETPGDAIAAMISFLEEGDLKRFFLHRYGELDRFATTDQQKEQMAEKLAKKFQKKKDLLLEAYRAVVGVEPEIVNAEGQTIAKFKVEDQEKLRLYIRNGIWTFHL